MIPQLVMSERSDLELSRRLFIMSVKAIDFYAGCDLLSFCVFEKAPMLLFFLKRRVSAER